MGLKPKLAIKLNSSSTMNNASKNNGVVKKVAAAFSQESDSDREEEDMPEEVISLSHYVIIIKHLNQQARMRMKNVGRETPTSAGPNSFGKTKRGFVDSNKLYERQLKEAMDKVSDDQ